MVSLAILFVLIFSFHFWGVNVVEAQTEPQTNITFDYSKVNAQSGANSAETGSGGLKLTNPLPGVDSIEQLIGKLLRPVFGIIGSLALVMFVYGGLMWMTSAGSSEKLKKGRETLLWASIGLFVVLSAYTLVNLTINTISN